MKQITTNELQDQLSKIIKEVETGEVYQVSRYSKAVAYLVSKEDFEKLAQGSDCKKCVQDLRKIADTINK
jgi:prevent-host-death family protein